MQKVITEKSNILSYSNERLIYFSNGDSDSLSQIDWKKNGLPKTKNLILEKILIIFHLFRLEAVLPHVENIALYPTSS